MKFNNQDLHIIKYALEFLLANIDETTEEDLSLSENLIISRLTNLTFRFGDEILDNVYQRELIK